MSKGLEALKTLTSVIKGVDTSLYVYNELVNDIEKELKEGDENKVLAKSYKELVFALVEELNIEFELSIDGGRDEDGQIDIDYFISLNGDRKKVGLTKEQYELFREWEEN